MELVVEFVSDFVRGEDKIRWGTCGFATYLISLYLSSNVQDQPPRPLARRGGNAHGISVNFQLNLLSPCFAKYSDR